MLETFVCKVLSLLVPSIFHRLVWHAGQGLSSHAWFILLSVSEIRPKHTCIYVIKKKMTILSQYFSRFCQMIFMEGILRLLKFGNWSHFIMGCLFEKRVVLKSISPRNMSLELISSHFLALKMKACSFTKLIQLKWLSKLGPDTRMQMKLSPSSVFACLQDKVHQGEVHSWKLVY